MVCRFNAVGNGGANKEGEKRGTGGVQRSPSSDQQKLVGRLDNDDEKKYETNKQQMMVVDSGW